MLACLIAAVLAFSDGSSVDVKKLEPLAQAWFEARPKTAFDAWDAQVRAALLLQAKQFGSFDEGGLEPVRDVFWRAWKKHAFKPSGSKGHTFDTPFGKAKFLIKEKKGKSVGLVVGLHGGGEGAGDAAEATRWIAKDCMGLYPQGIQLVHDTWNTVHGERFVLTLIEYAKVVHDVDPDRVYTMGFSMGGTGSWFMAGRHPDLLAGSSPCAGVLMASPKSQLWKKEEVEQLQHGLVPNVRNLAMYSYIGLADDHCMPGTFLYVWDRIEELREQDPGGYEQFVFKTYEGLEHAFPPGEPETGIRWLETKKRDTFPKKLVWEYASEPFPTAEPNSPLPRLPKHWFYWLHCKDPKDNMKVVATRDGNTIDLQIKNADWKSFDVLLNPTMIDVTRDVVVIVNGKEIYKGKPEPNVATVLETLDARADRSMCFDRRVELGLE